MPGTFLILDVSSVLYRWHHAPFPDLNAPDGRPTKALWGLTGALVRATQAFRPAYLAAAFDAPDGAAGRRRIDPTYKAGRVPRAPDITIQHELARRLLPALGAATIEIPEWEADDAIASLVTQHGPQADLVIVASCDKDLGALLVAPNVRLYDPFVKKLFTAESFAFLRGMRPEHVEATLAMAGDASDGIPPIGGFGLKTCARLLPVYGNLANLCTYVRTGMCGDVAPRLRKNLLEAIESGRLWQNYHIVSLRRYIDVDALPHYAFPGFTWVSAAPLLKELGFNTGKWVAESAPV